MSLITPSTQLLAGLVASQWGPSIPGKLQKRGASRLRKMGSKASASARRSRGVFLPQDPMGPYGRLWHHQLIKRVVPRLATGLY
jgi:hypothetical protein